MHTVNGYIEYDDGDVKRHVKSGKTIVLKNGEWTSKKTGKVLRFINTSYWVSEEIYAELFAGRDGRK